LAFRRALTAKWMSLSPCFVRSRGGRKERREEEAAAEEEASAETREREEGVEGLSASSAREGGRV